MDNKRSFEDMMRLEGVKWVYLPNKRIFYQFILDADAAGFTTGKGGSLFDCACYDIVAVHDDGTIGFVGFVGHMAFHSTQTHFGDKPFLRIDYQKFIDGEKDYLCK